MDVLPATVEVDEASKYGRKASVLRSECVASSREPAILALLPQLEGSIATRITNELEPHNPDEALLREP